MSINLLLLLFSFVFATPEQGGGEAGAKNTKQEQALVDTGRIAGSSNFSSLSQDSLDNSDIDDTPVLRLSLSVSGISPRCLRLAPFSALS
ncbi:hypothetical protein EP12_18825 [Alteromonas australica]|nr:hypothetical protein EP12_18825 [Alteromonas australica]